MNREQRRRASRGKRKTATLAGVSLAAASGLFGAYLGNGRIPKAYAAPVSCAGTSTLSVGSEAQLISAVTAVNANNTDNCFVLDITNSFSMAGTGFGSLNMNLGSKSGNQDITVDGNGHTISGSMVSAVSSFVLVTTLRQGDTLHVTDLTIADTKATGYGTAIYVGQSSSPGMAYLNNVTVSGNRNSGHRLGSAVHARSGLEISDSQFIGNVTYIQNPADNWNYCYSYGAAVNVQRTSGVSISNSVFADNVIDRHTGGSACVSNLSFGYGAGLSVNKYGSLAGASLEVNNSTFTGNTVLAEHAGAGAALNTQLPAVVHDSVFSDNHVTTFGGAPPGWFTNGFAGGAAINVGGVWYYQNSGPSLKVYSSVFDANSVTSSHTRAMGGAVRGEGTSTVGTQIFDSTFVDNVVTSTGGQGKALGGAVASYPNSASVPFTVVNSTLVGNSVAGPTRAQGGALFARTAPLSVDFSTITANTADDSGGGIYSVVNNTITNSLVNGNTAAVGADVHSGGTTTSDHSLFTSAGDVVAVTFTQGSATLFSAAAQVAALADNGGFVAGAPSDDTVIRTMLPLSGAAILGAGTVTPTSGVLPTNDQRGTGFPRVDGGTTDMGALLRTSTPPPPPPPPPVYPPSAPRDVTGVPGDGAVAVSWQAPVDAGSFPVTNYQVTAGPGGQSCLAVAPALTCTVTGLSNGTPYTFTVAALNGAGWGPSGGPSAPVTPSAPVVRSLTLFQGKRTADGVHDRIRTGGTSVGVPEGSRLTPWIRYGDTGAFKEGVASIVVDARGNFTWTREIRKDKKFVAYVAFEDLESNRVTWQRVR